MKNAERLTESIDVRVKREKGKRKKTKEAKISLLSLHKLLLLTTNDSMISFFALFSFVFVFCVTQKEMNESKSTVNNRTRCQLPYQINLSPVKAAVEV